MFRFLTCLFTLLISSSLFAQIKLKKSEGGLLFTENNQNVLFYQIDPKSKDGKYERCNYIHPLWSLDGEILTEDFPADHLHHRGIFWAWHQVWIGENRIGDPWEIKDFEQKVTEVEFVAENDGKGVLKTEVNWKSKLWKKSGEMVPYLKENTTITIHPQSGNLRRIDFEIRLLALGENLTIGGSEDDKGYSGFSVRMKLPEDVKFSGKAGNVEPQRTPVESAGFIKVSGSVGKKGREGGIVIMDHPDNPDYPQKWILRNRKSMQNAAWPGNRVVPLSTTEPLVLNYSLLIYSGELNNRKIQKVKLN